MMIMMTMMTFAQASVALTLEKETDKADLGHGTRAQVSTMNDDGEDTDYDDDILIKRCHTTRMNDDKYSDYHDDDRCPTTLP